VRWLKSLKNGYIGVKLISGSQNGWNHSGKAGTVNWMYGVMGIANAQRHLEQIRTLVEFISQDGIKQVVPM
jgi:glucan 1,3-beta-glucosidase